MYIALCASSYHGKVQLNPCMYTALQFKCGRAGFLALPVIFVVILSSTQLLPGWGFRAIAHCTSSFFGHTQEKTRDNITVI